MHKHRLHLFALFAPLLLLLSGCGMRFERDWKMAIEEHAAGNTTAVTGPWTGSWETETNGHTGDLRCLVERPDDLKDDTYRFRYHATWGKIFQGGYTADYDVKRSGGGGYSVKGSKDLGMFGEFSHDGTIRGEAFNATYESSGGDTGTFLMKRP